MHYGATKKVAKKLYAVFLVDIWDKLHTTLNPTLPIYYKNAKGKFSRNTVGFKRGPAQSVQNKDDNKSFFNTFFRTRNLRALFNSQYGFGDQNKNRYTHSLFYFDHTR